MAVLALAAPAVVALAITRFGYTLALKAFLVALFGTALVPFLAQASLRGLAPARDRFHLGWPAGGAPAPAPPAAPRALAPMDALAGGYQILAYYVLYRGAAAAAGFLPWWAMPATLAATAAVSAGIGLIRYWGLVPDLVIPFTMWFLGTQANSNYVGAYLGCLLPLLLALAAAAPRPAARAGWTLGAGVIAIGLLLSRSRAGWVAAGVGSLIVLALSARAERAPTRLALPVAGAALGILLGGLALVGEGRSPLRIAASIIDRQHDTNVLRLVYIQDTLRMIRDHALLGVGPGNFPYVYSRYDTLPETPTTDNAVVQHPHNEYLDAWAELGVGGFLALLAAGALAFRGARRAFRSAEDAPTRALAIGTLGVLTALAVDALPFFPLHEPSTAASVAALLGWLMGRAGGAQAAAPAGRWWKGPAGAAAGTVVALALGWPFALRPVMSEYHQEMGRYTSRFLNDRAAARAHQEAALAWQPEALFALHELSLFHFHAGGLRQAAQVATRLLARYPNFLPGYHTLGSAYYRLGEREKAREAFERGLAINDRYTPTLNNLGAIHLDATRYAEAERLFRKAIAALPTRVDARVNLGIVLLNTQREREALEVLTAATRLEPSRPDAWYYRAGASARVGDPAGALDALREAIRLGPDFKADARRDLNLRTLEANPDFRRLVGS
jgi:tetratricopeptide (TPR) repeat protein